VRETRPAPEGTRSRRCGRRLTGIHGTLAPAHGRQEGDVGTDSATPAEQATVPPHRDLLPTCPPRACLLIQCPISAFSTTFFVRRPKNSAASLLLKRG